MKYVIVGSGPAGVTAAETLRANDPQGEILLIGDEPGPPYSRMAIPYLLEGSIGEEGTRLRPDRDHFDRLQVALLEARVESLDSEDRLLVLSDGGRVQFDRLLLATGSRPVNPPVEGLDSPLVRHCWTLEDARHIMDHASQGSRVVLLGAGFIGCIIMEALVKRGVRLTVVEAGDRMVPRMMDQVAGHLIERWCIEQGIDVRTSTRINLVEGNEKGLRLQLEPGGDLEADLLVVAAGVVPNTGFLEGSGVTVEQGIRVDARQQTSVPAIYAAGDVCEGVDWDGGHGIHAIQPMAVETARVAALNMAGRETEHVGSMDMNVLDTLGLIATSFGRWQGVEGGDTASLLDERRFRYLKLQFEGERLIGAITLGTTDQVGALRGLIQSRRRLGRWKERLMQDPTRFMEAWAAIAS